MLKASDNPPIIYPEGASIADFTGTWWVAHTRSRNEKALAWQLLKQDVSYFLPMSPRAHRWRQRTIRSMMPLFTGYIFFCGDEDARLEALKTNRVAGLIPVKDPDGLVRDLLPIEQVLREGQPLQPHPYLTKGRRCRVVAGPLMGLEGIIVREPQRTRLVLQVEMLGQATSVEVDVDLVEPLDT